MLKTWTLIQLNIIIKILNIHLPYYQMCCCEFNYSFLGSAAIYLQEYDGYPCVSVNVHVYCCYVL